MKLQQRCGGPQEISETVVKLSQKRKKEDNILDIPVRQFLVGILTDCVLFGDGTPKVRHIVATGCLCASAGHCSYTRSILCDTSTIPPGASLGCRV